MIRVEELIKVFGPDPAAVLPLLRAGHTKSRIQSDTGHVVGVDRASFEVAPGTVFVIMGLSGSGKSTLIRCINRIIEPTAGRVCLDDPDAGEIDITALDREALRRLRERQMSMVFQHFALFPHRTVLSNATFGLEIQGRSEAERTRIGRSVLEMVGLAAWADAYPDALSGGMRQRVGLARALATEARVLLMDEPFSALDPLIKVTMQQELKRIQHELRRTILFITHDLDEAMRLGDRIAIMEDGVIVQVGTPEQILVNPRTEYVARFVEHADPTGVITAGTIALPFDSARFERRDDADGLTCLARRGAPELHYGIDRAGRLDRVTDGATALALRSLDDAIAVGDGDDDADRRRDDVVLCCGADTVLRTVLRARTCSLRPIVVNGGDGRALGVIDEPELVNALLEKRGYAAEPTGGGDGTSEAAAREP